MTIWFCMQDVENYEKANKFFISQGESNLLYSGQIHKPISKKIKIRK